ncbi:MAG TPA: WGxxGxxG family protein [Actinomycetota bacterium]|nr:WGxxGxxG family protein [Actinomycetota bacterium]
MKRPFTVALLAGLLTFGSANIAFAQDVEDTTEEVADEATNDQGDTGLLGLAGLLGLLGLLGLKRRDNHDRTVIDRDVRR